jgi:hypothetical protein
MPLNLGDYFDSHDWAASEPEPGLWHARFATEWEEDFDLYATVAEDWVHFAVSPFLPRPTAEAAPRLFAALLQINHGLRLARFALDADGDVNLVLDLPRDGFGAAEFALALDLLAAIAGELGRPLARMAVDPDYVPPELGLR